MIRKLIAVLVILAFVAAGLVFGSLNDQTIVTDYFFFETRTALAFSLVLFLMVGVALGGLVIYLSMVVKMRSRMRALQKELKRAEAESSVASTELTT